MEGRERAKREITQEWRVDVQVAVLRANNQKASQEAHTSDVGFNPVRQVWGLGLYLGFRTLDTDLDCALYCVCSHAVRKV